MYQLVVIEDKVICTPDTQDRDPVEVIIEQIELKFCNKILINVGLGISFFDFISIGDPFIYPGEGSATQVVKFRLVVFRPFINEILNGKILSSSKEGIRVSLTFFDDIFIPAENLFESSEYNSNKNYWIWKYKTEGEGEEEVVNEYPLLAGDEVRFKVRSITFSELVSTVDGLKMKTTGTEQRGTGSWSNSNDLDQPVMNIVGAMNDFGLGSPQWW